MAENPSGSVAYVLYGVSKVRGWKILPQVTWEGAEIRGPFQQFHFFHHWQELVQERVFGRNIRFQVLGKRARLSMPPGGINHLVTHATKCRGVDPRMVKTSPQGFVTNSNVPLRGLILADIPTPNKFNTRELVFFHHFLETF